MTLYLELTREFDAGRLRAVICSGQAGYAAASSARADRWPSLSREIETMPLLDAHRRIVASATGVLPERVAP